MDFAPSFFEHLSDRLELAVYDTNAEYRKRAFMDAILPPISYNSESPTMSITGYEPGSIQAKLAEIKKHAAERRQQSLAKLDAAVVNLGQVDDMIEAQAAQIDKETADALQEFAQHTNGGPA